MDKSLKKLEELKNKSENLEIQKKDVENIFEQLSEKCSLLNNCIFEYEKSLEELKTEETFAKNAPKEYKKEKKKLIKLTSIFFVIVFVLLSASMIGNIDNINIFRTLLANLLATSIATYVPGSLMFVELVKRYKTRDIKDIEADKEDVKNKLESAILKKNEVKSELIHYKDLKESISAELIDTNNAIARILEIRTSVIEEFCKDNLDVHSLLNNAYDEEFENDNKQKVK